MDKGNQTLLPTYDTQQTPKHRPNTDSIHNLMAFFGKDTNS